MSAFVERGRRLARELCAILRKNWLMLAAMPFLHGASVELGFWPQVASTDVAHLERQAEAADVDAVTLPEPTQQRSRRGMFFSLTTTDGQIAASVADDTGSRQHGLTRLRGTSQKAMQPARLWFDDAEVCIAEGGTKELLVRRLWTGADLQSMDAPGGQSGFPLAWFNTRQPGEILFDAVYPAIGVHIDLANPTELPVTRLVRACVYGHAIE